MNVPYHGIANPAWFDVQPDTSTGLSGTSRLLRVAMVATPEDVGANPTNEYNEPRRDFICAGIAGVCSTPLVDQEILRDPDGKILDVKDHVIEDAGRRVFYMDCTRAIEQFEGLFTRGYGESGGNFEEPDGAISRERVSFDRYGNVASYQAESAGASRELVNVANGHNQIVASEPAAPAEIEYDANGNLIRDGCGRRYEYDVENNLIRVFESAGQDERIVARFWYDGERRRIAAAYNDNSDGDAHTDAAFDNERIEHYAYDDLWRLRAVFVRDPESETAIWRERYVYDAAGINGRPTSARLDSPVAVQYNDDEDDDAERTSLIIANHLGDVIRLHHDDGTSMDVRYSLFGEPRSESFFADFNQDGAVDGDDVIVFFERWDAGDASADTDRNGSVDGDDVIAFFTWWDSGKGADDLSELRFGFRGYVRDSKLGLYHVRHRVYDPRPVATGMRWLQRDPAFVVDGMNLYGYCRGDPVNGVDPYGLDTWWVGDVLRSAGYAGLGDYTDDIADGGAFIFDMV
ncbi:MAG: RHS repeat-associated core domain-containing protein, partial [bacterium]